MGEKFVELIADSKSTFVSKASFTFLLVWLGILVFLKFFDIGMPEAQIISHSKCETLISYNISTPGIDKENTISCPIMVSKTFNFIRILLMLSILENMIKVIGKLCLLFIRKLMMIFLKIQTKI